MNIRNRMKVSDKFDSFVQDKYLKHKAKQVEDYDQYTKADSSYISP